MTGLDPFLSAMRALHFLRTLCPNQLPDINSVIERLWGCGGWQIAGIRKLMNSSSLEVVPFLFSSNLSGLWLSGLCSLRVSAF